MTSFAEFSRVRQHGQSRAGRTIVLATLSDPELENLKLGIIVTRKVAKRAVVRNRLRRRVHAIVRKHFPADDLRYLVVVMRWGAVEASFAQLEADVLKQARRLKLQLGA
ncbi:ribonuclease P protein component [Persicirhabdus sediminis]|uniref:Ribonuclease P protein component n=2 Tax=Persicirhabdus sediminis TaxID=454144 RepID=A0A8J7SJV0_9BACT|nr:ribonuclease P protein component [Persicirhabdus sediminis]